MGERSHVSRLANLVMHLWLGLMPGYSKSILRFAGLSIFHGLTFPGAAPAGFDRSETNAFATGTFPSLRAFEKNAAQLAAKAISSLAGELHKRHTIEQVDTLTVQLLPEFTFLP